ncbi:beta-ketoacyl-ACP synthase III [Ammoniphilus sp. CFH 90114]|uniref:beta-ketoacyl-ACP synthase III n=1 Tax=Ammoniphilus sp. CFH 90114 TaxID=2493665 RepID=UPI00100EE70A|nr:beta-ketoacyl-ACP synthase III [Ammoniphilus sp. CFH 90114]RXT06599.1 ketoacyl-ACP synthase III [Ammoniphilus sp. CFH 90114]
MRAGILGVGHYLPEQIMTNHQFEEKLETSNDWIIARTGIRERRIASSDMDTSDLAANASLEALEQAGITAKDIDLILVATGTADYEGFPSVACLVQDKIKARHIPALDLSAACAGFIYAMVVAKQFIETGTYKNVLVIGAEKVSKKLDWTDRNTAILFGDGAGAVVMGPVSEDKGILSFDLGSDGSGAEQLYIRDHLKMNGREVYKFAVRQMPKSIQHVAEKAGLNLDEVDLFIPHQANSRIIEEAANKLGVTKEKFSITLDRYANTCAATIPLSIKEELRSGRLKSGDMVIMVGFGAGLTWGSIALVWGK